MKELVYKFQNPHNSCEEVHYCPETKRYYILMPHTPYSRQLCTCTPSKGYYEADCPVRSGLAYLINGTVVTTGENGEIVDDVKKEIYENTQYSFFRVKPEYADLPNYEWLSGGRMVQRLFDYMDPAHFDQVTYKRKDVYCMMGAWYLREVQP